MRFKQSLFVMAMAIFQTGCMASPLPWAGAIAIPAPFLWPYPRLPALSPDGKYVAILGSREGVRNRGHLAVWDIEYQSGWSVVDPEESIDVFFELSWDSSSARLLFDRGENLVFFTPSTGETETVQVSEEGSVIAIFGPGEGQYTGYLLVPRGSDPAAQDRVSVFGSGTEDEDRLFYLDRGRPNAFQGMDWSADGTQLLVSFLGEDSKQGSYDIFFFDRATQEFRALIASDEDEVQPHWSSDGLWLVYLIQRYGDEDSELVFSSADLACTVRFPAEGLLMDVDWGTGDQLAVVYNNQLYLVDMRQAFGFGLDDIGDHCETQ